ncbi:MAG: SusC/RagA family TonB-linked outer membrane protein [Mariniphaga sp.]|nr:SusC/RagA family TonB-linked outer membrane protein [Mariniphaga sp.]
MKKKREMDFLLRENRKLILSLKKMKLTLILTLVVFVTFGNSFSQGNLAVKFEKATIQEVIKNMEDQSDFIFLYKDEIFDQKKRYSIDFQDTPFNEVLNSVCIIADVDYEIRQNRQIILTEKEEKIVQTIADQQKTVTGIVTDQGGIPLPGVSVVVTGTTTGTVTNTDGEFSLTIPTITEALQFSFIGMKTQVVLMDGQTMFIVVMEEETIGLEEVIAIGYGTQKVKELTGAVSHLTSESIEKVASSSFTQALQGLIAGVNVMSGSGAPGETANIQIRGIGSFSSDAIKPLFVVDGVPYDNVPNFGTNEIESINVLKDAASASIYGTRASNGVILITTKKGKAGQMRVSVDGYYGFTDIKRNIPLINNTLDWLYVNRQRYLAVAPGYFGWIALVDNPKGLYYNTDWMAHFQQDNAPIQNYSLQLSGGKDDLKYSLVTSYFSQDGMWVNSKYQRLSTRGNASFTKGKFSANIGMALSYDFRQQHNTRMPGDAIRLRPFKAPVNPDDFRIPAPGSNSSAVRNIARRLKEDRSQKGNNSSINMELNYEVFDGLILRANLGGSLNQSYSKLYEPAFELYNEETGATVSGSRPIAELTNQMNYRQNWITEFMGIYEKSFDRHNISAVVAFSMEQSLRESYLAEIRNFLSNDIQVLSGGSEDRDVGGSKYVSALTGSLARLQYNFAQKYLFSASVRRDGSSKFGENYKYGIFPSFSAGWIISEESFYSNSGLSTILPFVKIRASYGTAGNQFISDYLFAALIRSGRDYALGTSDQGAVLGATQTGFANSEVKWETSISQNLGLDLSFFDGKLSFTGDVYVVNKKDMLFPVSLPPSVGTGSSGSVIMNIGNMTNKGIELSSTYRWEVRDFNFSLTGIFMKNVNEVTQTNLESSVIWGGSGTTVIKEGYPVGTFFLIPHDGLVNTKEEETEYQKLISGGQQGDIKYVDVNEDGVINDDDRVEMGSGSPDWEAGLTLNCNYKNIDLYVQTYGTYGNKVYNNIKRSAYSNKRHIDVLNAWTPVNPTSTIPTPKGNMSHNNYRTMTDYYLEDGSYFRVRNIQLGYSLPETLINKLSINKCRLYVSVENPLTFTNYSGNDPEVGGDGLLSRGVDGGNIPVTSQYRFGFQLDF